MNCIFLDELHKKRPILMLFIDVKDII